MPKFIKPVEGDPTKCRCLKCKDSTNNIQDKKMPVNSVYFHVKSDIIERTLSKMN